MVFCLLFVLLVVGCFVFFPFLFFFFLLFNFGFRSREPRAVLGLASGNAILIPLKNSRSASLELCSAFHFPLGIVGLNFLKTLTVHEAEEKKGRFHLAWIYPGSDFLPEILI